MGIRELRTHVVQVPMTRAERADLRKLARDEGLAVAVLLRRLVREAIKQNARAA